jgi:sn1-specific diacylglycerol lipase
LIVGHSLGGGTGTILSILLKPIYPDLTCFTYGPPGGLLSERCMLETKLFITTIIVGKDMVPR